MGKRVRSMSLYHVRQCGIVAKPRSSRTDYIVVCSMTLDCSRKVLNTLPVPAEYVIQDAVAAAK